MDGDLATVEITPYALKAYLDRLLGADGRMSDFSYDFEARNLQVMGFSNLRQVDDCIRGFDAAELNRVLYSTKQGQLSRFEYLLTAGMGESYLQKHPWRDLQWFRDIVLARIDKFKTAGVRVANYFLNAADGGIGYRVPSPLGSSDAESGN